MPDDDSLPGGFPATSWTLLDCVQQGDDAQRQAALSRLCANYWFPLYAFLRKDRMSASDAQDAVQDFFTDLLAKNRLDNISHEGGKLRSYFLAMIRNQNISRWRNQNAQRHGGGNIISMESAEARFQNLPSASLSPDQAFDHAWATSILQNALQQLRQDYETSGKAETYHILSPALLQVGAHVHFATLATKLGISEGNARLTAFRMRKALRDYVEKEIRLTTINEDCAREELTAFRENIAAQN